MGVISAGRSVVESCVLALMRRAKLLSAAAICTLEKLGVCGTLTSLGEGKITLIKHLSRASYFKRVSGSGKQPYTSPKKAADIKGGSREDVFT